MTSTVTRRLRAALASIVLLVASGCRDGTIHVNNASAAAVEDGSKKSPFKTITRALEAARVLRFGSAQLGVRASSVPITIKVARSATPYVGSFDAATSDPASPSYDPTKEIFPLILNVPCLELRGETCLEYDERCLPVGVVDGTETTIRANRPQASRESMILVTRTLALASSGFPENTEMAGDRVAISGLHMVAEPQRAPASPLIAVDRVTGFAICGNAFVDPGQAVFTRLASGLIAANFVTRHAVGFYVTGGSERYPATVAILGNRASNEDGFGVAGLGALGAGETTNNRDPLSFGANEYARVPFPVFDLSQPAEIPDLLRAEIVGNEFDGHGQNGIRVVGTLQNPYQLPAGQVETARVVATLRDNVCRFNANWGINVDSGQINVGDRRKIDFDVSMSGNVLEENVFGPAMFSLWRSPGSAEITPPTPQPIFAHDSRITACVDLARFLYDNRQDPPLNPGPTNNVLTVNGVELTGRCIDLEDPCAAGIPAAPPGCGAP